MPAGQPIIEMKGIYKHFGGLMAVDNVDLELWPGECLAVVGENAAGKSTLIKVLTGVYKADGGHILMNGKEITIRNRHDAKSHGIDAVYQELGLVDWLNVPDNVFLGQELTVSVAGKLHRLNHRKMREESHKILKEKLGVDISRMRGPVFFLSGGQRQSVAIARAIYNKVKVLVMDEPVASLGVAGRKRTHSFIRQIKEQGVAVIYIGHNLEHVFSVADRIMVIRSGKLIGVRNRHETTKSEIVQMIAGV